MNSTFNLLYYLKKAKINTRGEAPIYMRITIDGKISEISTKRVIIPSKWNSKAQNVKGISEECRSINFYLKTFEQKVYDTYHLLIRENEKISCELLKNRLLGKDQNRRVIFPKNWNI
ncbi:Arm DNA-binding domain-containing protein [Chryseobacterium sp. MYb264]|uniref:Arm DNA-binding domain-containing protein n=1 Tax=Chryseobacterium sp. MYb264 TaxID=2745153 RepID=UPI002E0D1A6C|nr:Arm DNA-binding domain-containing protein [Chryseobacterium sp. MYb264]